MSQQTDIKQKWAVAPYALQDAYTDFMLSRQAMMCTKKTMQFYEYRLGKLFVWLDENGVTSLGQITSRHIRAFLSEMIARG